MQVDNIDSIGKLPEKLERNQFMLYDMGIKEKYLITCGRYTGLDHEGAAELYAKEDHDGHGDGITEWRVEVTDCDGITKKVSVTSELELTFYAEENDDE